MEKKCARLTWLHISDIHLKVSDGYQRDSVLNALIESLPNLSLRYGKPDVVFFTGDIAFSGKSSEYAEATKFFDKLLSVCSLDKQHLFVIPGNHDVDRQKGKGLSRTVGSSEEADAYFDPSEPLPHLVTRQSAFLSWYNQYFSGIHELSTSSSVYNRTLTKCDHNLSITGINSAIFCVDDHDHAKLWIGNRSLESIPDKSAMDESTLSIALIHHPFDWLAPGEQTKIKNRIRGAFDVVLSGHLHENSAELVVGIHDGEVLHLSAGAAYQTKKWPNSAMFCTICDGSVCVHPIRFSDSPVEVWVPDTGVFPGSEDFSRSFEVARLRRAGDQASTGNLTGNSTALSAGSMVSQISRTEFEQDLFISPTSQYLYVEPRIMTVAQDTAFDTKLSSGRVSLSAVVDSQNSFVIESRAEYGATSLTKRIAYELHLKNEENTRRDARKLPKYKKKLEDDFKKDIVSAGSATLVLDNVDLASDERLISEIIATGYFRRIIAVSVSRGVSNSLEPVERMFGDGAQKLFLWPMSRDDIRSLAGTLFATHDQVFLSKIVDKVYSDLTTLCIPLTPPTVIMYLRVLHREGEFHPLNRVDILARYLDEMLRKPSDVYTDGFNVKNKIDIVSAFIYDLYKSSDSIFDEKRWYDFSDRFTQETLVSFPSGELLDELFQVRVFARVGRFICVRYSFFYVFFLGRHLASRDKLLEGFLEAEEYLSLPTVVDVITGLRSDNSDIIDKICSKSEDLLERFAEKYVEKSFDPLIGAVWARTDTEYQLWSSVAAELEKGPRKVEEIDAIKTSMIAEARSADQEVKFREFAKLERDVFYLGDILSAALINADDVSGNLKLRALEVIYRSHLVAFQTGCALAPLLSKNRIFQWGGVVFLDFDQADVGDEKKTLANVIFHLACAIAQTAGEGIGSQKLAGVFNARDKSTKDGLHDGLLELINFHSVLSAKGEGWADTLARIVSRTDKSAFYLRLMLDALRRHLRNEILQIRDRERVKWLIATIRAKREFNKQDPGSRAIKKVYDILETRNGFLPATQSDVIPVDD